MLVHILTFPPDSILEWRYYPSSEIMGNTEYTKSQEKMPQHRSGVSSCRFSAGLHQHSFKAEIPAWLYYHLHTNVSQVEVAPK